MRLFGRSATSLANALNKSPSVMLILYKAIEEGARFRSGVWMDTIPEFDAGASVGDVCGVFSVAGYEYKVLYADASFSPAADCSGFSYVLNLTESVLYKCQNLTESVLVKCLNLTKSVLYIQKNFTFCAEFSGSVPGMPGNVCRTRTPWPPPCVRWPISTQSKPHQKRPKIPPLSDVLASGNIDIPPRRRCPQNGLKCEIEQVYIMRDRLRVRAGVAPGNGVKAKENPSRMAGAFAYSLPVAPGVCGFQDYEDRKK